MKAAFWGTNHPDIDARPEDILRQVGLTYIQQLVGYTPRQTDSLPLTLPHVIRLDQETVDKAMTVLCGRDVQNCNRRAPYLMLVWILVGSDNAFRVTLYAEKKIWNALSQVGYTLLQMAMGFDVQEEYIAVVSQLAWELHDSDDHNVWPLWADEAIAWVSLAMENTGSIFVRAIEWMLQLVTRVAKIEATVRIHQQANRWAYLDDETVCLAINFLFTDIMDLLDTA